MSFSHFYALSHPKVNITVLSVNDLPKAFDDKFSMKEDDTFQGNFMDGTLLPFLADADVEGSNLTAVNITQPNNGVVTWWNASGFFVYTPDPNFNGDPNDEDIFD